MAAAATVPMSSLDLRAPGSYPVRLGAGLRRPIESTRYSSVRYNRKERLKKPKEASYSITPSDEGASLSLQDDGEKYGYEGRAVDADDRYVLLCRGSGKDKEMVLERIENLYDFNLTSAPSEADANKLRERYTQIPAEAEGGDDLFGDDEDVEEPVDADNPFDFRNHLKKEHEEPKPSGADTPHSSAATPRPAPRATASTPLAQPKKPVTPSAAVQKKRKAQDPLKPNSKRVKAGTEPPPPVSTDKTKPKDVPSVRLDRKASTRRPSLDDSGELILENETPVTEKPPRAAGAMALALSGALGQGPISLRSAASSPASRNASPMPPRPDGIESPAEFELGETSSPERSAKKPRAPSPRDYFSNADEDEEDADADVEDLELPSPRQRRKSVGQEGIGGNGGGGGGVGVGQDEDYDMERELELALAQDDGGVAKPTVLDESEESEEE